MIIEKAKSGTEVTMKNAITVREKDTEKAAAREKTRMPED